MVTIGIVFFKKIKYVKLFTVEARRTTTENESTWTSTDVNGT